MYIYTINIDIHMEEVWFFSACFPSTPSSRPGPRCGITPYHGPRCSSLRSRRLALGFIAALY